MKRRTRNASWIGTGGARDASASLAAQKEITVQQLLTFLLRDVEKTKHYRRLPFYMLFLAILTTLVSLTGLGQGWQNEKSDHNDAIQQVFQREEMRLMESHDELWEWLRLTTISTWVESSTLHTSQEVCQGFTSKSTCPTACTWLPSNSCEEPPAGRRNIALGFLLLRQWRVSPAEECNDNTAFLMIPENIRKTLPTKCTGRFNDNGSDKPFGRSVVYYSDDDLGIDKAGGDIDTETNTYRVADQFSQKFLFSQSLTSALDNLTSLQTNTWVTAETRLVSLSAVFFNRDTSNFLSNDAYVEFFHTGKVKSGSGGRPFSILSLDTTRDVAVFVLDCIHVVIFVPVLFWSLVRTVRDHMTWMKIPGSGAVGLWEIFEFSHIAMQVVTAYFRISLWASSLHMSRDDFYDGDGDDTKMIDSLTEYGHLWRTGWSYTAAAVVMAYLRIFKYLQYNQRLCVLSETIRTAAGDLAGMTVIFTVVLTSYALGGTMLYSGEVEEFTSYGTSCAYLLQVLFAGEVVNGIWKILVRLHPVGTPIYMLTYFLLSWVVLLNMVIAALSNAFILVVQQQAYHRRSEASGNTRTSIWADISKGVRKGWKRMKNQQQLLSGNMPTEEESLFKSSPKSRSKDPTEFLMLRTNKVKARFSAVSLALKRLADDKLDNDDEYHFVNRQDSLRYTMVFVTWSEVNECLRGIMTDEEREAMFGRVHKLIACDEQNSQIIHMSHRYCSRLSTEIAELLGICRVLQDGNSTFPQQNPRHNGRASPMNDDASFVQNHEVVWEVPPRSTKDTPDATSAGGANGTTRPNATPLSQHATDPLLGSIGGGEEDIDWQMGGGRYPMSPIDAGGDQTSQVGGGGRYQRKRGNSPGSIVGSEMDDMSSTRRSSGRWFAGGGGGGGTTSSSSKKDTYSRAGSLRWFSNGDVTTQQPLLNHPEVAPQEFHV